MSIGAWWFGQATESEPDDQTTYFGGRVILTSHYDEIYDDFAAACDEVRLFPGQDFGDMRHELHNLNPVRGTLSHPAQIDESARDAMTLAGYIDNVNEPVILFQFGNKVPGVLRWRPYPFSQPDSGYQGSVRKQALAQGSLPDGFDAKLADEAAQRADRLASAYQAARQRVDGADRHRTLPLRSWYFLVRAGIWAVAIGLLVWLILVSSWPVPAYIVALLAVATSARAAEKRVRNRHTWRNHYAWERGPLRLRLLTRQEVRDARWNDRRDLKIAVLAAGAGAILTFLATALFGSGGL